MTPATRSLGFETPYLLVREVPPPLAFVLHLCQVWSPEVVIALIGLGILYVGLLVRVGLFVRSATRPTGYWPQWLNRGWRRRHSFPTY